jgi:hypothetical protein
MKRKIAIDGIRKRVPAGFQLPTSFARFAADVGGEIGDGPWFHVAWANADPLRPLDAGGRGALLPFLRFRDGGVVAFWLERVARAPIVHLDSEGGQRVVGTHLDDFFARLARRRTGVPDLDDCAPLVLRGVGKPAGGLGAAQRRFVAWTEAHSALRRPTAGADGEKLRRAMMTIARKMLGKLTSYTARDYWSVALRAERKAGRLVVTYMGKGGIHGVWPQVPPAYGVEAPVAQLLTMVKHPNKGKWDITITKSGIVTFDRDKELLLVDPATS